PHELPAVSIQRKAFDSGITAIDTSPYYGPSEVTLGEALRHSENASIYPRHTYFVATKVGRIATNTFDYPQDWVRYSVKRSLERLS
ncbi:Aldo/keto reductase, partial [Terfezia boudieri ATCC MYA-4762]